MKNDQLRPEVMKTQAELMLTDDLSERIKETIDKCYPSSKKDFLFSLMINRQFILRFI